MISRSIGIGLATILITGLAPVPAGDTLSAQEVKPMKRGAPPRVAPTRGFRLHRTWVVTGIFDEVDQTERTEVTINEPVTLRFRWGTNAPGAEEGFWRLRGIPRSTGGGAGGGGAQVGLQAAPTGNMAAKPVDRGIPAATSLEDMILASGVATAAPGGQFEVDLRPYLPPTPPGDPLVYRLDVIARTKMKADVSVAVSPGQAGAKVPAEEIGAWATPVVITYVANTAPPTQFAIGHVYRKVTLVLDHFVLVEDQMGPGDEEYHLGGFVQELARVCLDSAQQDCRFSQPLAQRTFQHYRVIDTGGDLPREFPMSHVYDPSSKTLKELPHRWEFDLGMSGQVVGPRQFLLAVSLLEEDAGGSVDNWNAGLGQLQKEVKKGDILEMAEEELTDYLLENADEIIRYVADGLRMVSYASDAAGPIGAAIAVVAAVTSIIVADMEDDYYGTRGATLRLVSNRTEEIHKLPGTVVGTGAERRYVVNPQKIEFKGPPASNQAGAWDGIVEIEFHWEFSEPEQE